MILLSLLCPCIHSAHLEKRWKAQAPVSLAHRARAKNSAHNVCHPKLDLLVHVQINDIFVPVI